MSILAVTGPPLAAYTPWTVTSWPTLTGVLTLCVAVIMGSFVLWRQRRNLELAWGEIARVWERSLVRVNALGDLLPDIFLETDEHRNVTFANRAFFRITGYREEDLHAGLSLNELLEPADRPGLSRALERAAAGRNPG